MENILVTGASNRHKFLSRVSTLTRDIDIAKLSVCLSVRLSVCLSVTFRYQMTRNSAIAERPRVASCC